MRIPETVTRKEQALIAFEAHWFGSILRSTMVRELSGQDPLETLEWLLAEYRRVCNIRDQVSREWDYVERLVRDNAETDYLVWRKSKQPDIEWTFESEAEAREQFMRFRIYGVEIE